MNPLVGKIFKITERIEAPRAVHWGKEFSRYYTRLGEHFIYIRESDKPGYCYGYTFINVCKKTEMGLIHLEMISARMNKMYFMNDKTIFQARDHMNDVSRKYCHDTFRSSIFELPLTATTIEMNNTSNKFVLDKGE